MSYTGIIKQCNHPHSLPPTPKPTKKCPTHPYLPKIMSHPPPTTQNNASLTRPTQNNVPPPPHPTKIMPHLPHSPLLTQNNAPYTPTNLHPPKITPLPQIMPHSRTVTHIYSITHIYSNFSLITR